MRTLLVPVLLVLVVFIVLYLVARRVRPLGNALAFVCALLGCLLVKLEAYLAAAAAACCRASLFSLRLGLLADSEVRLVITIIARVVYFLLALCVFGGETVSTLSVLPTLLPTATTLSLPGIVHLATAVLIIGTSALFGAVVLECVGFIPHAAALFPPLNQQSRSVLGVIAGVFLLLSIILLAYFYLFRGVYLLDPQRAQGMSLYILGGLGLLVAAVSVPAAWALVLGSTGVVSLLFWIAELGCTILSRMAALFPSLLEVLSVHFSSGTMSVYQDFDKPEKYPVPPLSFSLPPAREGVAGQGEDAFLSSDTPFEKENKHMRPPFSLLCVGSFGSRMGLPLGEQIEKLQAHQLFRTSARLDLSHPYLRGLALGREISVPAAVQARILASMPRSEEAYPALLTQYTNSLVKEHVGLQGSPSLLLCFLDCHTGSKALAVFAEMKERLPLLTIVVVIRIRAKDCTDPKIRKFIEGVRQLHQQGVFAVTIVVDPASPFASRFGEEKLLEMLSQALISVLLSSLHSERNPSAFTVFNELGSQSAFASFAFASDETASGKTPAHLAWLSLFTKKAAVGDLDDMVRQTARLSETVMQAEQARAWSEPIALSRPCDFLSVVPLRLDDPRFGVFIKQTDREVRRLFPNSRTIVVRGNGIPYDDRMPSVFRVGCSCLYPLSLPILPEPAQEAREYRSEQWVTDEATTASLSEAALDSEVASPAPLQKTDGQRRSRVREKN